MEEEKKQNDIHPSVLFISTQMYSMQDGLRFPITLSLQFLVCVVTVPLFSLNA